MRRVVITGLGVVSCLGNNQDEVYQSLLNAPLFSLISVILSNISIGGSGNFALPGPKRSPFPQVIRSS